MKPAIFLKDLEDSDTDLFVAVSKLIDIKQRKNYHILRFLFPDGILDTFYFGKEIPEIYKTFLVLIRVVKQNSRTIYRIFSLTELDYIEELFWRKIILDRYTRLKKKVQGTSPKVEEDKEKNTKIEDNKESEIIREEAIEHSIQEQTQDIDIFCDSEDIPCIRKAILEILEKYDKGSGVPIETISEILDISRDIIDKIIAEMLMAGEIYEYSPGRLKVLK